MERVTIPWRELWQRYAAALAHESAWLRAAVVVVVLLGVPLALGWPKRVPRWLRPVLLLPIAAFAVWQATRVAWVADDAFISFRYAYNLSRGDGLVFNVGERVEGYTNFLWTLFAAVPLLFHRSPLDLVLATSLLSYIGVIFMTARLVALLAPAGRPVVVSFAALAVACNFVMSSFATSGLETMAAAFCVLLALERATLGRPASAGWALAVATLLHPDHLVFGAALGATYLLDRDRKRALLRYLVPFAVLLVPHALFRLGYYRELVPNTYYAKGADTPYYSQGAVYLAVNLFATSMLAALPLSVLGLLTHLDTRLGRFSWLGLPLYLYWVAKIGGDFMLGRLLVPVLPIALVLAELFVRRLAARGRVAGALTAPLAFGVLLAGVPVSVLKYRETAWHIANESDFYKLKSLYPPEIESGYFADAKILYRAFTVRDLHPRYATGCVGIVGYFTHLPILDTLGLNDRQVAHKPLGKRGRPGHEKGPNPADVIPRGVDFSDLQQWPPPYSARTELHLDKKTVYLMSFRTEIMDALVGQPGVSFEDARNLLDTWDPLAPNLGPERRACDAWFFTTYYFSHNDDPRRRATFLARLVRADPALAGVEQLLVYEPPVGDPSWVEVGREGFEDASHWHASGDAFRAFPTRGALGTRGTVAPVKGFFADSYDPLTSDDAVGLLASEPFTIVGDAMTLRVGGGLDLGQLKVSLVIDQKPVAQATGCNSEVLGIRVWNVSAFRGRLATLEIRDAKRGGWAHIVVDEIVQWQRRSTP